MVFLTLLVINTLFINYLLVRVLTTTFSPLLTTAAAIPKFGRIALFRNLVPHSARPPAPSFLAARYTFPVKVS